MRRMPGRLPPPGPSYIREHDVRVQDRALRAGMGRPNDRDGGWGVTLGWVAEEGGRTQTIRFVNVRENAGWSAEGKAATPKTAHA